MTYRAGVAGYRQSPDTAFRFVTSDFSPSPEKTGGNFCYANICLPLPFPPVPTMKIWARSAATLCATACSLTLQAGALSPLVLALTLTLACRTAQAEDLTCLKTEESSPGPAQTRYDQLKQAAHQKLAERLIKVDGLKSADQIAAYQQAQREFFLAQLGGFPERSPLNSRVVGTLAGNGYRIEK